MVTSDNSGTALLAQDPRDLEALFRDHHDFVWRSLLHLGMPRNVLDDGVQDVFLVVHRRRWSFRPGGSVRGWLYGIARRIASEYRRGRRRGARPLQVVHDIDGHGTESKTLPRLAASEVVRRMLEKLDADKREVFLLAEVEGMTAAEISEAIGVNPNTVSARLRAARKRLERALAKHELRRRREEA